MTTTRVSNYGDGNDLLTRIVDVAGEALARLWIKIPWWDTSEAAALVLEAVLGAHRRGVDVLVLCRPESSNDAVLRSLRGAGVTVVPVRYIHEKEVIADDVLIAHSMNFTRMEIERNQNSGFVHDEIDVVDAAVNGFEQLRSNAAAVQIGDEAWSSAARLLPERWLKYIDRPRLNPLQSKAIPAVLSTNGHVMVVAPTSSGKTLVGEVAALRSILEEGKTAVWLLPARALAAEVAETAERWRKHGIRSVQLTGEVNLSSASIRQAQLWVATTEKFESLYRRSSLRDHIGNVGCLIIDEVHLVGDESRGATLESLIARLRQAQERTRIVALSATVSNADEVAAWFNADLVRTDWRPTVLTTQLVPYKVAPDARWGEKETAKNQALRPLLADLRANAEDPATVLVFCGSKRGVQSVALAAAGVASTGSLEADVDICFEAGVGMHFRDAPRAQRALQAFRSREASILVATSGLSTGVNTPARAVIIRDLQLGITPLEVSQAQQMLGRAGRAGQEEAGFGFILVPEDEMSSWRKRLSDGYTVKSHIIENIADAVLAEILLGTVTSRDTADSWFEETFAYSLGATDARLSEELDFLVLNGFVTEANNMLTITAIGLLTSRLMVDVASAAALLSAIAQAPTPTSASQAEQLLISIVAASATPLTKFPVNENSAGGAVATVLGHWTPSYVKRMPAFGSQFCAAAAELSLNNARTLRSKPSQDMPLGDFRRAVEDMPRYFAWVAALGYADQQSWIPAVAGDLARRLTWWQLAPQPERGHGRLLWLLEKVLEPQNQRTKMQNLWGSARTAGVVCPDQVRTVPSTADVSPEKFTQILQGRANLTIDATQVDGAALHMTFSISSRSNRLTARTHRGRQPAITTVTPAEREVRLELPPAAPQVNDAAIDAFLYTSDGDWAYDSAIAKTAGAVKGHEPIGAARAAAQLLPPTAVVAGRKSWRSNLKRGRRKHLEEVTSLISPLPGLSGVAAALAGHDPEPARAAWFITTRISHLLEIQANEGSPRHPATVLRSGHATSHEVQYCIAALLRSLQLDSGIAVFGDDTPVAVVELEGQWHLLSADAIHHGALTPVYPESLPAAISALQPPPVEEVIAITPILSWVHEFSGIGPSSIAQAARTGRPAESTARASTPSARLLTSTATTSEPDKKRAAPKKSAKPIAVALSSSDGNASQVPASDMPDYIAEARKKHKQAYAAWTQDAEIRLLRRFQGGATIEQLMSEFQRNEGGILSRLKKLGEDPEPGAQAVPSPKIPDWAPWGDGRAPLIPAAVRYLNSNRIPTLELADSASSVPSRLFDLDGVAVRPTNGAWSAESKKEAVKAFTALINDWTYPHLRKEEVIAPEFDLDLPPIEIENTKLSRRSVNCLSAEGINEIGDIDGYTWAELLDVPNLGLTSLIEILCTLESLLSAFDAFDQDAAKQRHQLIAPDRTRWSTDGTEHDPLNGESNGVWLTASERYQSEHDQLEATYGSDRFNVDVTSRRNLGGEFAGESYLLARVDGTEVGVIPMEYKHQCPDLFERAERIDVELSGCLIRMLNGERVIRLASG